jgi:hypothetical protein
MDENLRDLLNSTHVNDQAAAGFRQHAEALKVAFDSFRRAGFTDDQAWELVKQQHAIIWASLSPRPAEGK